MLVGVLGLYTYIAYRAVARSAEAAASERVIRVAAELTRSSAASAATRARQVDSMVNRPAVRTALREGTYRRLDTLLSVLRQPGDSSLDISVYDTARRPVHFLGRVPHPELSARVVPELEEAERAQRAVNSAPFEYRGRAHYWVTAAVRDGVGALGYVAQLREIRTTPAAARTLNALIGSDGSILFASTGDPYGRWITLEGTFLRTPEQLAEEEGSLRYRRNGRWYLGALDSIAGTKLRDRGGDARVSGAGGRPAVPGRRGRARPINAILGYADLMEAGVSGPLTELQREQIGRIKLSGRHLVGLIDDLLDFARIERARLTV